MRILGIDNGLDGGLVVVDDGKILAKKVTPTVTVKASKREFNAVEIVTFIRDLKPDHIFLEKAQAMPGQGVSSMFSIGLGYGLYRGILTALYLPFTLVHPKTWQGLMFRDLPKGDTKAMSYIVCMRLWPKEDWKASERCKKPHDGLTDAAMIAGYGSRML